MKKAILALIAALSMGCGDVKPKQTVIHNQPIVNGVTLNKGGKTIGTSYEINFQNKTYSHCEATNLDYNGQNIEVIVCPKGPAYTK